MIRLFRRFLPFLLVGTLATTGLDGCFIFHGKNHCGDCPDFHSNGKPKKAKKKKKHH